MVARLISRIIAANTGLFLASSLPIREMDMFADCAGPFVHVAANRGASGIDGTVASASGFAAGLGKPVTALVGDLALLHDLNSMALLKSLKAPVVLVVLNNNGGNIFSFLPIAAHSDLFEKFFITPHGYTLEHAAGMFGINYHSVQSQPDFVDVYARALQSAESSLIEIPIDRRTTVETHNAIADAIHAKLGD
jgi:2-succinyl-5-enolpyruvyl-6-hydroxy-3-cyclohexene-1-carboxylate synthase